MSASATLCCDTAMSSRERFLPHKSRSHDALASTLFSLYHVPPYGGGKSPLPEYISRVQEYEPFTFGNNAERDVSIYDDAFAIRACAWAIDGLPASASSINCGSWGSPNCLAQSSDGH